MADPWCTNMLKHLVPGWIPTGQPAKEKPGSPHEMAATLAKPQPQMHTSVHGKNTFPWNNEPTSKTKRTGDFAAGFRDFEQESRKSYEDTPWLKSAEDGMGH